MQVFSWLAKYVLCVGRVDSLVVALLNRLASTQLSKHFRVEGTHALYAFESAAGVRLDADALATFVPFKPWLAGQAGRDPLKRRRDVCRPTPYRCCWNSTCHRIRCQIGL